MRLLTSQEDLSKTYTENLDHIDIRSPSMSTHKRPGVNTIATDQGHKRNIFGLLGFKQPDNALARNNAVAVFLMGALPAVAGSAISFMLGIFLAWGLISLALGRFEFRLTRLDRQLAWAFTAYAALVFATGLFAENGGWVFRSTLWLLPFLASWAVIPRLRATPGIDYLQLYILGAGVGCIGALAFAGFQISPFELERPEGGAGNAAVFATLTLCLAGIAGLGIDAPRRSHRLLAGFALVAGLAAVVLSLTRGVIMVIPLTLILLLAYSPRAWRAVLLRPATLALLAGAGLLLAYSAWGMLESRLHFTLEEVEKLLSGAHSDSMGERVRLWGAAWSAFKDSPLWGYGVQNRMDALVPYLMRDNLPNLGFTHPHNAYLTALLDGGLIVLAALLVLLATPIVVAWRAPRDAAWRQRLFLALVVTGTYAATGMTQIMFKHDIMDAFFIFTAIVIAASAPPKGR